MKFQLKQNLKNEPGFFLTKCKKKSFFSWWPPLSINEDFPSVDDVGELTQLRQPLI